MRTLLLGLSLLFAVPALATTVVAQGVEDLALDSTAFVEARVGPHQTFRGGDEWHTDTVLEVLAVHAGQAPERIAVRQAGGEIDGRNARIPGDAVLVPGERIVAFVRQVDGRWYFTSLGQSVWHVEEGPKARLRRDIDGLNLYQRMLDGSVRPAIESLPEYSTLGELVNAVRGLALGGGR